MPTVSPVNIKKQLSVTWKISEDLKKEAILEIAESIDSEMVLTRRLSEQPSQVTGILIPLRGIRN